MAENAADVVVAEDETHPQAEAALDRYQCLRYCFQVRNCEKFVVGCYCESRC